MVGVVLITLNEFDAAERLIDGVSAKLALSTSFEVWEVTSRLSKVAVPEARPTEFVPPSSVALSVRVTDPLAAETGAPFSASVTTGEGVIAWFTYTVAGGSVLNVRA